MSPLSPVDRAFSLLLMNELRAKKNEGWDVRVVKTFPKLAELEAPTFLGAFSWSQAATKTKWIKQSFAYNIGGGLCTPSDIARDYLAIKYPELKLRCNRRQYREIVKQRKSQPIFAQPADSVDCYYLDMVSAYWQILCVGGWDVDYSPARFLAIRSDVRDFPAMAIKLARNCLVSLGLPSSSTVWLPDKGLQRMSLKKQNINLVLWGFVQDVLHGIADDMIERAGAIYVNTDGYIIPTDCAGAAFEVADAWGITLTVKHIGKGTVRGVGDYDIGSRKSARLRKVPRAHRYILPRAKDWLRKRFQLLSSKILLDYKVSELVVQY